MKICAACCEELPKESFSKKQWQLKQHQRRCKECIETNRDVQLKAPSKNDTAAGIRNPPPPCAADNEGVSCWICLEEGPDELGEPLVRDCSCRGESGHAHLSCIIQYAEQKSRCVHDSVNGFLDDFNGPWGKCPNCKQRYRNKIAIDLATAFLAFTQSNYPEHKSIHLKALNMKLDALAKSGQLEDTKKVANKILSIVRRLKMNHSSLPKRDLYVEARAHDQLGIIHLNEGTKESAKSGMKHFEICRDILKSAGNNYGVAATEAKLAQLGVSNNEVTEEEKMEKFREAYKQALEHKGEESYHTIHVGINMARSLHNAHCAIEAERLLSKIARVSNRVHGLDHELSQEVELMLQYCKVRYVYMKTKWDVLLFKALRYENNGEKCIINGPLRWLSSPGNVAEEETTTFATKNIILSEGTPVICHGLIKSNHLNGKLGDIRSVDEEKTGHYEVHFEDEGLKPRLIKPKNVRILFELPDIKSSGILQI
mmetsp:Transcript_30890/g.65289  ORF Transcript_30890/g.65289 Transcript_30890/m.65289 type:complete len:484 (-) Transcript_30890:143-1594(-)